MNNRYIVRVSDPLLRPGLEIETEASEKYLVAVVEKTLDLVREINDAGTEIVQTVKWYGTPDDLKRAAAEIARKGFHRKSGGTIKDDKKQVDIYTNEVTGHDFHRTGFSLSKSQRDARNDAEIKRFTEMMDKTQRRNF